MKLLKKAIAFCGQALLCGAVGIFGLALIGGLGPIGLLAVGGFCFYKLGKEHDKWWKKGDKD